MQKIPIKLSVIGPAKSGKSSIITRYTKSQFSPIYNETLGIDYSKHSTTIDQIPITHQIVPNNQRDISRHQLYSPNTSNLSNDCKGSQAIIIVFDKSSYKSFSLVEDLCKEIRQSFKDVVLAVVGFCMNIRE